MAGATINQAAQRLGQRLLAPTDQPAPHAQRISTEAAQSAATEFLLDHVGNQLLAGQPHLMVSTTQATWVVPIHLAYLPVGLIGSVGVVAVDAESGRVVAWTPTEQIKAAAQTLREAKEPYITQHFQSLMTDVNPTFAKATATD